MYEACIIYVQQFDVNVNKVNISKGCKIIVVPILVYGDENWCLQNIFKE
jgi:hypothetical protein